MLLAFLPEFEKYRDDLKRKNNRSQEETHILTTASILIDYLHRDYKSTIATFKRLISHGEITFELLHTLMVPRSTLVTTCPVTGEPRALELVSITKVRTMSGFFYDLLCESVDAADDSVQNTYWDATPEHSVAAEVRRANSGRAFGRARSRIIIAPFAGTIKINSLDAYPIRFHTNEQELREKLITRGRKWASLAGIHHVMYSGTAALAVGQGSCKKYAKFNVRCFHLYILLA